MQVKLAATISGTRDGVAWPPVGSVVDLPDDEAQAMLYAGTARALKDGDMPEATVVVPDDVDEAVDRFIPETARHEPVGGVELLPDEDRRPNMDAIGLADDGEIGHGPSNPPESLATVVPDGPVDMSQAAEDVADGKPLTTANGPAARVRRATPPSKK